MVLSLNEEGLAGEGMKSPVNVYDGPVHRLGCNECGKFTCLRKIQIYKLNISIHCNRELGKYMIFFYLVTLSL